MERILDFSAPLDVALLDSVVDTFYNGIGPAHEQAQNVLQSFVQDPRSWRCVDSIITQSSNANTRFLALSSLENAIKVCRRQSAFALFCVFCPHNPRVRESVVRWPLLSMLAAKTITPTTTQTNSTIGTPFQISKR